MVYEANRRGSVKRREFWGRTRNLLTVLWGERNQSRRRQGRRIRSRTKQLQYTCYIVNIQAQTLLWRRESNAGFCNCAAVSSLAEQTVSVIYTGNQELRGNCVCYLESAIPLRGCYQRYGAPYAGVSLERYRVPKFPAPAAGSARLSTLW